MQEYKKLFLHNRGKLWQYEDKHREQYTALDNYKFTVSTVLSITVEKLKKESALVFDLLAICSFLGSKNIPDNVLKNYAESISKVDSIDYRNALSLLVKHSLLIEDKLKKDKAKGIASGDEATFTIHELTQIIMRDFLKEAQEKTYINQCLLVMAEFLPTKPDVLFPLLSKHSYFIHHMNIVSKHALEKAIYNDNLFAVKQRLLEYYLSGLRHYQIAQRFINEIEELIPKITKSNQILRVRFLLMKGALSAWHDTEDYQESLRNALSAFELLKNISGHDEERLEVYNMLTQQYISLGDNKTALKYAKLGEDLVKKNTHLSNQDVLFSNLTKIHMNNGNLDEALAYSTKMISSLAHAQNKLLPLPGDIPVYLIGSRILIKMGKYEDAFKILIEIHNNLQSIFSHGDHNYKSLAEIYYAFVSFKVKNVVQPSKTILLNAIKKLSFLMGEDSKKSRLIAYGYGFLGEIHESERNYIEALRNYDLSLQTQYNHYKSDQIDIDDISELYTRLAITNVKLGDNIAAQKYLDLHRDRFGHSHIRTIEITKYMLDHAMNIKF